MMPKDVLALLRCPLTRQPLILSDDQHSLQTADGQYRYPIEDGIAMLLASYGEKPPRLTHQSAD